MKNKLYLITEDELLGLLEAAHRLRALKFGGVDNWSWYDEAISDYKEDNKVRFFEELARQDLKNYNAQPLEGSE